MTTMFEDDVVVGIGVVLGSVVGRALVAGVVVDAAVVAGASVVDVVSSGGIVGRGGLVSAVTVDGVASSSPLQALNSRIAVAATANIDRRRAFRGRFG